jgi:signal transduction histidine kinase
MRLTLLTKFSLISLALFLVIGALLGWGLTTHFELQALEQRTREMTDLVQPVVGNDITQDVLDRGARCYGVPPEERSQNQQCQWYRQMESSLSYIGGSGLVRVKIWNTQGKLVYTDMDEGREVGKEYPVSANLRKALNGESSAEIVKPDKEENTFERGYGELLEVYTPLVLSGSSEPAGAFEGYFDVEELREDINFTNGYLWTSIATGFLFLFVSLFTLVRNASQRILRQSRENSLLLADTQRKAMRLETLNELARSINESSLDLEDVFRTALRGIDRTVRHDGACITLLDERTGEVAQVYRSPEESRVPDISATSLAAKLALLGNKTTFFSNNTKHSNSRFLKTLASQEVLSYLLVPISLGERQLGLIEVESHSRDAFDEDDVTVLKSVADQLALATENTRLIRETAETTALRETNRLKDEFVSMVSHELRTPLASIKGYARTLLTADGHWDEGTKQEFVSIISDESDKLADLVENLLEMSRIEAGRMPINPEPMLLQRFCRSVVDRVGTHHPEIKFGCAVPKDMPLVLADPRRVEQVLVNLLQNAAKYSQGDLILVRARYETGSPEAVLSVEDNGVGIAPEHLPHLFDKFYRVDGRGESTAGTGLGLSIAQKLVEAQGGRIWVESKPGTGTCFTFTLPIIPEGDTAEELLPTRDTEPAPV